MVMDMSEKTYQDMRRDEIANEFVAPTYASASHLEQKLIDYCVEVEMRLADATGADMRREWASRLSGSSS